jgi:stearoyl-CoA desaturase (delta-9 desaturase)
MTAQAERKGKRSYGTAIGLGIVHLGALGVLIPALFSWQALAVAIVLWVATGFGITLGYHRLLTHRSLALWKPAEYAIAILGTLALQGGPIEWVATHRAHHAHSDHDGDPHDSHKGMPWAHVEWLFRSNKDRVPVADRPRWAPDLVKDPFYHFLDRNHVLVQVVLGLVLLGLGGWSWVVWGVFARIVFTYHGTWLVNSASHAVGYRTYKTGDRSTNNWWVALISFGEGWHNNHHAFPFSARHGLRWFEFDMTFWVIRILKWVRIARDVRIPTREMMQRLRLPRSAPRSFSSTLDPRTS